MFVFLFRKQHTNTARVKLIAVVHFSTFLDKNRIKVMQQIAGALMWGTSGCRGYVYLQIKPSVLLKQYLPGFFRYTSAVKPWVQPSLYCVNLPSFSQDSISFLPPPNTPIRVAICFAQLTRQMLQLMVANIAGNNVSVAPRPPCRFAKPRKSHGNQR